MTTEQLKSEIEADNSHVVILKDGSRLTKVEFFFKNLFNGFSPYARKRINFTAEEVSHVA